MCPGVWERIGWFHTHPTRARGRPLAATPNLHASGVRPIQHVGQDVSNSGTELNWAHAGDGLLRQSSLGLPARKMLRVRNDNALSRESPFLQHVTHDQPITIQQLSAAYERPPAALRLLFDGGQQRSNYRVHTPRLQGFVGYRTWTSWLCWFGSQGITL